MIRRHIWVKGRVQGVGFRWATVRQAEKYPSVKGWIRNLEDGRVEGVFQGPSSEVLALVAWCKKGPVGAKVDQLEVREEAPTSDLKQEFNILK